MSGLLSLLLPAFLPVAADAVRGLIARFTGGSGAQPQNVAEAIQLINAQTARVEAMAKLDAPAGNVSKWVANLRASFRYIAVGVILLATLAAVFVGVEEAALLVLLDLSGACMSFIIGERMYLKLRQ